MTVIGTVPLAFGGAFASGFKIDDERERERERERVCVWGGDDYIVELYLSDFSLPCSMDDSSHRAFRAWRNR